MKNIHIDKFYLTEEKDRLRLHGPHRKIILKKISNFECVTDPLCSIPETTQHYKSMILQ